MDPTESDAYPDPLVQPEVSVYMPGTPTVSFLEYAELFVDALSGRR
ncbi:hypothetical protein [Natrinema marinum]|nr:hypothetical protein [Natrinema marinum]